MYPFPPPPPLTDDAAAFRTLEAAFGRIQRLHGQLRMAHSRRMRTPGEAPMLRGKALVEFEEALAAYRQSLERVAEVWGKRTGPPPSLPSVGQFGVPVSTRASSQPPPGSAR